MEVSGQLQVLADLSPVPFEWAPERVTDQVWT